MERTILQSLIAWKKSKERKPLILNGARQVGKTWVLHEFAKREYKQEAYVVCRKNGVVKTLFSSDFDVNRILRGLRAITSVDITPGDTLIIMDEVQDVPEVIESLKYFCEQAPEYHIAVAGSLLGISLHSNVSYPVGKVDALHLYPMSFEEFLLAKGEVGLCKAVTEKDYVTTNAVHEKLVEILREYYYVGGMPEAVQEYVNTGALQTVRQIQERILSGYDIDFSKHAPAEQVQRIRMVWKSIPSQLFKENKKFFYGVLRKGARAKDFEIALEWLVNAGLVYKVPRCSKLSLPLVIYEELSAFKLFFLDLGLLGAMVHTDASQVLVQNNVFQEYKGGMTEQYVLQQLKSHNVSPIFYHTTDDSRLEIDFLVQQQGHLLPIEVKAEGNVRANSLTTLLNSHPDWEAVRYSMLPYKEQGQLHCLPLYMIEHFA
ncbi:MAG: ATP-binding protein [Alloprevotella sp.]